MDDRFDSLTVFHERVDGAWYDRYESMDEASGWSETSAQPWFFRFRVSNATSPSPPCHLILVLEANTNEKVAGELVYALPNLTRGVPAKPRVLQHDVAIQVVGVIVPVMLLASWLFAFWRINRKGPLRPPDDADGSLAA
jgi:hypothetical protein